MTSYTGTTLNYPITQQTPIKRVKFNHPPAQGNFANFILGDEWLDTSAAPYGEWWKLATIATGGMHWVHIGGQAGDLETLSGNVGGEVPPDGGGNINLLGAAGQIVVTGNPSSNTLTLSLSGGGTAIDSITSDSGGAVGPDSVGNLNLVGTASQISIIGTPGTNTQTVAAAAQIPNLFTSNSGTATPASHNLNITGAGGVTTSASGSTLLITGSGTSINQFLPDTGTTPVVPNGSGQVTMTGPANSGIRVTGGANQLGFSMFSPFTGAFTFNNNVTFPSITISNVPVNPTDGTNKAYVDSIAAGLLVKQSAYAGTTANLSATYANGAAGVGATLTNNSTQAAFSVDGVSPPINSRILVKDQTTTFQNGIYTLTTVGTGASNWVLTRSTDYDQPSEINQGDFILIDNGTVNAHTAWVETATVTTIGTDPILFSKFQNVVFPITIAEGGSNATSMANTNGINYFDGTRIVTAAAMTNGQFLIGSTGAPPVASTLTAGSGISIVNGAGSVSISSMGGGLPWTEVTITGPTTMAVDNGYIANNAAAVQLLLPATAAEGSILSIVGKGAGGWVIQQNSGQTIHFLGLNTTTGAGGGLVSTTQYDAVGLICITANTDWAVIDSEGNISVI